MAAGVGSAIATVLVKDGYYALDKDKWTCVATFKDDGSCAAYASNKLIALAKASSGPST